MCPTNSATVLIHEANSSDRVEQMQHLWLRFEVFKEGTLVQSQLRMQWLRWYHKIAYTNNPAFTLSKPNCTKYGVTVLRLEPQEDRYACEAEFVTDPPFRVRWYQWRQAPYEWALQEAGFRNSELFDDSRVSHHIRYP